MKFFNSILIGAVCILSFNCHSPKKAQANAQWMPLFNGKDLSNWMVKIQHHDMDVNFGNTFRAEEGIIKVRYDQYGDFNDQFAHLYYKTPFSSFHLRFEYRFVGEQQKGAPSYTLRNSGVMFHSQDPRSMPKEQDWPISIEMQLLGGLSDGKPRPTGNMCSPGTDIVINGKIAADHCVNSSSKTYDGEQWVKAELIVLGDSMVKHIINGDTVLQYSKPQIGGGIVNRFDPAIKQDGKPLTSGYIALQSEGHPVDFKNIELRDLSTRK
jgi:Domain of Unknown Function (DUF1080)